ncbi:hypothetical protein FIBSPDRAFT_1046208 [Athelia psychrophila]|uniref:HMG box domain-containing protein n=1 Tax=Athelia psychrophila TaxID=1759441 RepID=A0A166H623_9AGAM|nr:hypothetical protein FIBSPDRAFT_1046208 [Fibularhizoctonia sp. CBS 109695]
MLSISSQRGLSRLGVSLGLSRVTASSSLLSARRSFVTSDPRCEAAADAGETSAAKKPTAKAAKKATGKAAAKAGTKTTGKAAAERPAAKKGAKEPKVEKPVHLKLTKEDMPPKRPGNSYILFLLKYRQGLLGEHKEVGNLAAVTRDGASMWNTLTEAEKQPFMDDYHRARALYDIERQAYFDNVPSAVLKEINRRRISRGTKKIRVPQTGTIKRVASSFVRFLADFRGTAEAAEIRRTAEGRNASPPIMRAAGEKWHSTSEEAKAPYVAEAKKDMDAYLQAKAEAKAA